MSKMIMYLEDNKIARELFEDYFKIKKYDVRVFGTAPEAEKALSDFKPNVIIADQKLGDDSMGWEFLKKAKTLSPNSMRYILSGYAEQKMIINSFTDGLIFDYILKNEPFEEIEKKIENGFIFLDMLKQKNLLIDETKRLSDQELQHYQRTIQEIKFYTNHLQERQNEIQNLTNSNEKIKK